MLGIYYKDGVYVVIDNNVTIEECVFRFRYKNNPILYGGRVIIDYGRDYHTEENASLLIDGVEIIKLNVLSLDDKQTSNILHLSTITLYLNAIEANGVDAFMQHYNESLLLLQEDLLKLKQDNIEELSTLNDESLIEAVKEEIKKIKALIYYIIGLVFTIRTFMSAGLENEKVISVYQSIMETIT